MLLKMFLDIGLELFCDNLTFNHSYFHGWGQIILMRIMLGPSEYFSFWYIAIRLIILITHSYTYEVNFVACFNLERQFHKKLLWFLEKVPMGK